MKENTYNYEITTEELDYYDEIYCNYTEDDFDF